MYILDEYGKLKKSDTSYKICVFITDNREEFNPEDDDLSEYVNEVFSNLDSALKWINETKPKIDTQNIIIHQLEVIE